MLTLNTDCGIRAQNGGLFVSRGRGTHPRRRITSYELIFVVSGVLQMREETVLFECHAGQTLLLWPERQHEGTTPYASDTSFYWVHFDCEPAGSGGENPLSIPQTTSVTRSDVLTGLFRRFLDDQEAGVLTAQTAGHWIALMLHEVALPSPARKESSAQGVVLARHAQQYLVTHSADPSLSLSQVARLLDCHPDYLGRCFRAAFGITLTDAIHRERLKQARTLLMDGSDTIESVARACGFPSPAFFRRVFQRIEGVTPSAFRRLYARVHVNTV